MTFNETTTCVVQPFLIRRLLIVVLLGVGCCFAFRAATTSLQASSSPEFVWKNIEDLQPGDLVVAREEHGTEVSLRPVKDVYRRTSDHLRHLTFRDQSGQEQVFSTTDEHPFWSVTANSFVDAGSLPIGHQVTGPDGALQTLVQTQREDHPGGVPVFNFQVDDYHTYFVSAHGRRGPPVLVHNADGYVDVGSLYGRQGPDEFSSSNIRRIRDDMKVNGYDIDHPIEIAVIDGRNVIIDGHHRARAAGAAGVRDVPVVIRELAPEQAALYLQQAAEAAQRLGLDHRW